MEIWDKYPEVYHYTKFSSSLLILHSATLKATRFDLLNDTQEIKYVKNVIAEKILERNGGVTVEKAKQATEIFQDPLGSAIYITSFCGKNSDTSQFHRDNGLLSMWGRYGADGGCAFVFNTQKIYKKASSNWESLKISPAVVMDEVIYKGKNDNDEIYLKRLDRFVSYVSKVLVNPLQNPTGRDLGETRKILEDLLPLQICSKHPAFFEEQEVRIGLIFLGKQYKSQAGSSHQFYEIPFSPSQDISRIIIGPHRDQQSRYDFLTSYLSKMDLNIEVTMSEIPLRF